MSSLLQMFRMVGVTLGSFQLLSCSPSTTYPCSVVDGTLTITPEKLHRCTKNSDVQRLKIQGAGKFSTSSIPQIFPFVEDLHIEFTPDIEALPSNLTELEHLHSLHIVGSPLDTLPNTLSTISVQHIKISHNPYLKEIPNLQGSIEHIQIEANPHHNWYTNKIDQ